MHTRTLWTALALAVSLSVLGVWNLSAQVPAPVPATPVQLAQSYYALVPISATGGSAAQVTLTIPAPASNLYNYVCTLSFSYSQTNTTGTAQTNAVTTSTNFNGFGIKFSTPAAINTVYDWSEIWGEPASGCPKSLSPGTATTFVSPSAATNGQYAWYAVYYQAP